MRQIPFIWSEPQATDLTDLFIYLIQFINSYDVMDRSSLRKFTQN